MIFFCFSIWLTIESTSPGFLMKDCSAGVTTVEAKSGRESRSRNCAMDWACLTKSSEAFCRGVYLAVVAWSEHATTEGSAWTRVSWAGPVAR